MNVKTTTYIYGLVDPRDGRVRYVGKANAPEKRLRGHLADKVHNRDRQRWLAELNNIGLCPRVVFLEKAGKDRWQERERFQIAFFRERGLADLNITDGGEGHTKYKCNQATRLKLSKANKGKPKPPFSEEHCRRISDAHRGKTASEETRKKMSVAAKLNGTIPPQDYETRSKAQRGKKCKPFSEDHRRKLSERAKGNKNGAGHIYICTDETRTKLSAARRCRPYPGEETRHKLSTAAKKRWAAQKSTQETINEN